MAPLPLFLNCGFHYHHLPLGLSELLPCAKKTGVLTGNLPEPQSHSQTPAASKLRLLPIPVRIHAFPLECHGSFLSWPGTPAAGSHGQSQDSLLRAPPLLLGLFITKEREAHVGKCCLTLANHLALGRGAQEPGSQEARKPAREPEREPERCLCGSGQAVELSLLATELGTLSYCPLDWQQAPPAQFRPHWTGRDLTTKGPSLHTDVKEASLSFREKKTFYVFLPPLFLICVCVCTT